MPSTNFRKQFDRKFSNRKGEIYKRLVKSITNQISKLKISNVWSFLCPMVGEIEKNAWNSTKNFRAYLKCGYFDVKRSLFQGHRWPSGR